MAANLHLQVALHRLVASGALTRFQADWIESVWPELGPDALAHPHLRSLGEHTRAYLAKVRS